MAIADKDTFRKHNALRKKLKQPLQPSEIDGVHSQLLLLAKRWQENQASLRKDETVSNFIAIALKHSYRPESWAALNNLLEKSESLLTGLNKLSLQAMEISDQLAVSSYQLSEEQRLALEQKKLYLNDIIWKTTSGLLISISKVTAAIERESRTL